MTSIITKDLIRATFPPYVQDCPENYDCIDKMYDVAKLRFFTAYTLLKEIGPRIIDYFRFSRRINVYRDLFYKSVVHIPKNPHYISSLALLKLGIGQCGEINEFIKHEFFQKTKLDGKLISLGIINRENNKKTHVFSIFIKRSYKFSLDDLNRALVVNSRFTGFTEIARIIPKAYVLDGYFKEAGKLETITESCPKLLKYIKKFDLNYCADLEIFDSKTDKLTDEERHLCELESDKLAKYSSWIKFERFGLLDDLWRIYSEDVKNRKKIFKEKFPEFEWRDSGAHLFVIAPLDRLIEFCKKELGEVEHTLIPSSIYKDHYFLVVGVFSD